VTPERPETRFPDAAAPAAADGAEPSAPVPAAPGRAALRDALRAAAGGVPGVAGRAQVGHPGVRGPAAAVRQVWRAGRRALRAAGLLVVPPGVPAAALRGHPDLRDRRPHRPQKGHRATRPLRRAPLPPAPRDRRRDRHEPGRPRGHRRRVLRHGGVPQRHRPDPLHPRRPRPLDHRGRRLLQARHVPHPDAHRRPLRLLQGRRAGLPQPLPDGAL
ncbi:MAG: hypothetical protein AVDCRST_MAG64-405, partial [uncultured Phycisphaerae bacterium]